MNRIWIPLCVIGFCALCGGCSGGNEVADAPKPVSESNPNKFNTALEGGNASSSDSAGKSVQGGGEGH